MRVLDVFGGKVRIAVSDRRDGNMRAFSADERTHVIDNQAKVGEALGVSRDNLLRIKCDYGRDSYTKYVADADIRTYSIVNWQNMPVSDGILVYGSSVGLILPLADCLGAVLYDEKRGVLMLVHSGRHNLAQAGLVKAVQFMKSKPRDIRVFFSPVAGKDNYRLDYCGMGLAEAAIMQLVSAGVPRENIEEMSVDTTTDDAYFSHSQGDTKKRFAIGVKKL